MKTFAILVAAILGFFALSGCVVVPAYEPGYRGAYGYGYFDQGYPYYGGGGYRRYSRYY